MCWQIQLEVVYHLKPLSGVSQGGMIVQPGLPEVFAVFEISQKHV